MFQLCCRLLTFTLLLLVSWIDLGSLLLIQSEGQVHVLRPGDSLVLDCDFHADHYNLFDYPVLWRKSQAGEETQMNIMGNINDPYMTSNRFEVAFTSTAPRFRLELTIVDLSAEDSGNYTCEVRGPQSVVLGRITHYVYVQMPVERVIISDDNFLSYQTTTAVSIHLVEGRPNTVRCAAFGGYPPPSVELFIGQRDVTVDFRFSSNVTLSGRQGLRQLTYRTDRWAYDFVPTAGDDQLKLKCIATVVGLKIYVETVQLSVDYAPKINCTSTTANPGERNIAVACFIRAKPQVSAVFWIVDANGTSVSDGDLVSDHWTLQSARADGITESTLYIRQMTPDMFRRYTLVAENSVSVATSDVIILQKEINSARTDDVQLSSGSSKPRDASRDARRRSFFFISSRGSLTSPLSLQPALLSSSWLVIDLLSNLLSSGRLK